MSVEPSNHWLVPFAGSADTAALQALARVPLPHLQALLGVLDASHTDTGDTHGFSPPHERALAHALGLPMVDGQLPWAALGSSTPQVPQAWVHPVHFQVGMDAVSLTPAAHVGLDDAASNALFDALAPLCAEDGVTLSFESPTRWRASGERLRGLVCASLDRVAGRSVAAWMPRGAEAGWLKRLQSEAQMLFYTHPVNDAREAARQLPVNGIWVSDAGAVPATVQPGTSPTVIDTLREGALRADVSAWTSAWAALDAGPLREARQRAQAGQAIALTLCGERSATTFTTPPSRSPFTRLARALGIGRTPRAHDILDTL